MSCNTADFLLYRSLRQPDAAPFLGLLELAEGIKDRATAEARDLLSRDSDRLPYLFSKYPYFSVWLVAQSLNAEFGRQGQMVYPLIEDALGVQLPVQGNARRILYDEFKRVCDKLGLPSALPDGEGRPTRLYLLHAGVARAQLHHLIGAFLRQHDRFGAPPTESTAMMSRWEDDALEFMPENVITPRRAILWDETAWNARLYARISRAPEIFNPATDFEKAFYDSYNTVKAAGPGYVAAASVMPRPRLHWGEYGLVLRLPRSEGRIPVRFDDEARARRYKGGEDRALGQPWPCRISCEIDGMPHHMEFLSSSNRFAVFDMTDGTLLTEQSLTETSALDLDSSDALIASRRPFKIGGEEAMPQGDGCWVQRIALDLRGKTLSFAERSITLRTRPRRRLSLKGDHIASGRAGRLFGMQASIHVETGLTGDETRMLRLSCNGTSWQIEVEIHEGSAELPLSACDLAGQNIGADPARLQVELMAPPIENKEPRPSGITLATWIWPGFTMAQGTIFHANPAPTNFHDAHSSHVWCATDGLHLDAQGGYAHASAAFEIDGEIVVFRLPWPDIMLQRHRADGTITPLQIGARIGLTPEDRLDHLSIRCPDRNATLLVGQRVEAAPFALGMTRNIALSELIDQGGEARVLLQRGGGAEVLLVEVVDVMQPTRFELRPWRDGLEIDIGIGVAIDAVALEAETEFGERQFYEVALGRRPVRRAAPDWLSACLFDQDTSQVRLHIVQTQARGGLCIGRCFIRTDSCRPDESWRPLRNARGDGYIVPLTTAPSLDDAPCDRINTRYETLSRWMSECYALECWIDHGLNRHLPPRWRALGEKILDLPLSRGLLVAAALAPPPDDTSPSFVPLLHPIEIDPNLYSDVPACYLSLDELAEEGLRAIAQLNVLATGVLRDGILHPQALMAFRNSLQAMNEDTRLEGFDPKRLFDLFPHFDTDPSAGWFWQGTPLLGPDHLRAACLRMVERFDAAHVFAPDGPGGGNRLRGEALIEMVRKVWEATRPDRRPRMPRRRPDDEHPVTSDMWVAVTLSEFAAASRSGKAQAYVEELAARLCWSRSEVLTSLGFLLRLAPELFIYFLLVWHLSEVRA